jgi:acyl-CoA reductase-like NAD-dependent aldehyde dehydrogenase
MEEFRLLIKGRWEEGKTTRTLKSPYDQKAICKAHFADRNQVSKAVSAADKAFHETKRLSSLERSKILERISSEIERKKEDLARSIALGAGKAIKTSRIEAERAVNTFQIASEEAKRIYGEVIPLDLSPQTKGRWGIVGRFPIGVITGITPFNFPLNLVAHKVAPAIASGNTFVLRPASQVSITSAILAEIIVDTDLPPGGFNFVPSGYDAAEVLLTDEKVKMVTFTGSPAIGWDLKKKAYKKKVTLELGGNAAVVIEPDADLDFALSRAVLGAFAYSGQICISVQRIFLHEKIYDCFMADFVENTKKLRVGNPLDEATDIGPMINEEAALQTEE